MDSMISLTEDRRRLHPVNLVHPVEFRPPPPNQAPPSHRIAA